MTPLKRRYTDLAFKSLMTAAYILLFAVQFNSRFYSIANFFVYSGRQTATISHATVPKPSQKPLQTSAYRSAPRTNLAHLGLDKRFHGKHFVNTFSGPLEPVPYYTEIRRTFYVPAQDLISVNQRVPSLRGPPCA